MAMRRSQDMRFQPTITRVRVVEQRSDGLHVRYESSDGGVRTVWVPDALLEDAKRRLMANHDLVAPTDGGPQLGTTAADLIGILCSHAAGPGVDALYEASWVGASPIHDSGTLDQAAIRAARPPQLAPASEEESEGFDSDTTIVLFLAAGAALALGTVATLVMVLLR